MNEAKLPWTPVLMSSHFVLFPSTSMPITVSDPHNVAALKFLRTQNQRQIYVAHRLDDAAPSLSERISPTLCLAELEFLKEADEGEFQVLIRGLERHTLSACQEEAGVFLAQAQPILRVIDTESRALQAYLQAIKDLSDEIIALLPGNMKQIGEMLTENMS